MVNTERLSVLIEFLRNVFSHVSVEKHHLVSIDIIGIVIRILRIVTD